MFWGCISEPWLSPLTISQPNFISGYIIFLYRLYMLGCLNLSIISFGGTKLSFGILLYCPSKLLGMKIKNKMKNVPKNCDLNEISGVEM